MPRLQMLARRTLRARDGQAALIVVGTIFALLALALLISWIINGTGATT